MKDADDSEPDKTIFRDTLIISLFFGLPQLFALVWFLYKVFFGAEYERF